MLTALVRFSLQYRFVVLPLACLLVGCGIVAVQDAPWDVFPEFAPPQLVIQTEAPGRSTGEVERLVTTPVESALGSVTGLVTLRSASAAGLSVVTAIFSDGVNLLDARQLVGERLAEMAGQLPAGVGPPRLTPLKSATSKLLTFGLTSEGALSLMELRTLADWSFRPRLQAVPGVAQIEIFGGEVREYQVLVTPDRLQQYNVSLDQVVATARAATGFGGAGYVETANQRLPIRQQTRIESAADIAAAPIQLQGGAVLSLGQVADVAIGSAARVGAAAVNGRQGVLITVHKQPGANTLEVTAAVQAVLAALQPALPPGVTVHANLFRQANFLDRAIGNLTSAIWLGCLLVALVLVAFLFQWRTVFISLTAIPLSLLGAILVLRGFGASLNAMTLGGLAVAVGELVDDAIVDVENVLRRLRASRQNPLRPSAFQVVLDASLEVRGAVVYASFIVMLVFLPVFFLDGVAGKFFRPLAAAYVISIVVSLLVALTVTPALCLLLLRAEASHETREPPITRWCRAVYVRLLPPVLARPRTTMTAATLVLAASLAAVPFLGGEFLPDFHESNFVVWMVGRPDGSLTESLRAGGRVTERLLQIDGVAATAQQVGRAELSEDTWGPNMSEIWISLEPRATDAKVLEEVRRALADLPGFLFQTKQFLRERIDEVLGGAAADVVIRLRGPDLDRLREQAQRIAGTVAAVPGVADLQIEQQVNVPQIELTVLPRNAARYGLTAGDVHQALQTLLQGTRVGQVFEADRAYDIVVRADPKICQDPLQLARLTLNAPAGRQIPLSEVATLEMAASPNVVNHEGGGRRLLVTLNARHRDVASLVAEIQRRLSESMTDLPTGYFLEFAGEHAARAAAARRLALLAGVALVGVFLLLYLDFQAVRPALIVMLSVPLACVGGVAAAACGGGSLSLGSLVGFVTVFGIAVRNGILLVSHFRHLQQVDQVPFSREMIVRGAGERLPAVLMTATATALALLPLVVYGDLPGREIEYPMALIILGGLTSSTCLTLFVLPVAYEWLARPTLPAPIA